MPNAFAERTCHTTLQPRRSSSRLTVILSKLFLSVESRYWACSLAGIAARKRCVACCRAKLLAGFKAKARTGVLDVHVPVRSMRDVMMSDYRHLDGTLEDTKQLTSDPSPSPDSEVTDQSEAHTGSRGVAGDVAQTARLPGIIFNRPPSTHVLYQVVRWQLAKRRSVRSCQWQRLISMVLPPCTCLESRFGHGNVRSYHVWGEARPGD